MRKLITGALALTLLASTAGGAFAQEHGQGRGRGEGRQDRGGEHRGADRRGGEHRGGEHRGGENRGGERAQPEQRPYNPAVRRGRGNWPGEAQPAQAAPQPPQAQEAPRAPDARRAGDWDRRRDDGERRRETYRGDQPRSGDGWRREDRRWEERRTDDRRWDDRRDRDRPRYDRRYYPPVWRTPQRYRVAPYRAPPGWYSYSWSYGHVLPRAWYGPQYRLIDWWAYGLPIPPIGYAWVRVGDDALLVDEYSGRIVQVVYDLFW